MEEKTSINFDKAVITPLEKRVDVTLELDAELIAYLLRPRLLRQALRLTGGRQRRPRA